MSKRFTDSDKWEDPWFRCGSKERKLAWQYLLDKCDHAGIWKKDFELLNFYIGSDYQEKSLLDELNVGKKRIIEVNGTRWFIPSFLLFQYPKGLKSQWKATASVINILKNLSLTDVVIELYGNSFIDNSYLTVQDKDKDNISKELKKVIVDNFIYVWERYPSKVGRKEAEKHYMATVKTEHDIQSIKNALNNYLTSKRVQEGYIQNGSTWFNDWASWVKTNGEDSKPEYLRAHKRAH